jgi:murein DD-endopeptidase MepM/ murein hydrolase activator NlpD
MSELTLSPRGTDRPGLRFRLAVGVAVFGLIAALALPTHASAVDAASSSQRAAVAPTAVDDSQLNAGPSSRGGAYMHDADAAWVRPVAGRITSNYGPRPVICTPAGCSNTFHDGVDFGSACGTPIKAISPGRVISATNAGSFGERVIIDHGSGLESIYGHLQAGSYRVSVGQLVQAGTIIANVGMTGVATGCHLDLKIRTGAYIDPGPFLAFRGVKL